MSTKKRVVGPAEHEHTETLYVRVNPLIKEIIEEEAASAGITLSQHIRSALVMDALLNGNPKAAKLAFASTSELFKSELRQLFKKEQSGKLATS